MFHALPVHHTRYTRMAETLIDHGHSSHCLSIDSVLVGCRLINSVIAAGQSVAVNRIATLYREPSKLTPSHCIGD